MIQKLGAVLVLKALAVTAQPPQGPPAAEAGAEAGAGQVAEAEA